MNLTSSYPNDLRKSFLLAFGAHGVLILFFFLASKFNWIPALSSLSPLSPEVKMLQTAVRVDVVAMPSQTLKELKNREFSPPPENLEKAENKIKEESNEKNIPDKNSEKEEEPIGNTVEFKKVGKKDFMSLLKNLSKKELKTGSAGTNSKVKTLDREELNNLILSGNKISKGNSLTGSSGIADEGAFAQYVSAIPFRVKNFWKLPSYLLGRNLKCRIRIYINSNGELIKTNIFESSGVEEFDQRAVDAIEAASPFPTPEESFSVRLIRGEIALGFPL
jgi:TonB family protein